jgi:hypothetical protein
MDHETAIRLNATERYFLGELPAEDRDAFEEHYFECEECAADVQAMTIFAANAREVFRQERSGPPRADPPAMPAGVLSRHRVLWISAALNLCLLAVSGYIWFGVQPQIRRELAEAKAPQFVQDVSVLGVARGPGDLREIAAATRRIVFSFYLREPFQSFAYQLKPESGPVQPRQTLPAPPKEDSAESHLSISTAGLEPGVYEIAIWGINGVVETPVGQSKFRLAATH